MLNLDTFFLILGFSFWWFFLETFIDQIVKSDQNLVDWAVFVDHFLMMTPTLSWGSCFGVLAHFRVNSSGIFVVLRFAEGIFILKEEVDVPLLLKLIPMIAIFMFTLIFWLIFLLYSSNLIWIDVILIIAWRRLISFWARSFGIS